MPTGSPLVAGAGQTGETLTVMARGQSLYERYWADIRAEDRWRAERQEVFGLLMRFRKVSDAGQK